MYVMAKPPKHKHRPVHKDHTRNCRKHEGRSGTKNQMWRSFRSHLSASLASVTLTENLEKRFWIHSINHGGSWFNGRFYVISFANQMFHNLNSLVGRSCLANWQTSNRKSWKLFHFCQSNWKVFSLLFIMICHILIYRFLRAITLRGDKKTAQFILSQKLLTEERKKMSKNYLNIPSNVKSTPDVLNV